MDTRGALRIAIAAAGSQAALGDQLGGYTQNAIHAALKAGKVSPAMAARLDEFSAGAISRYQLRPDVFGSPPAPHSTLTFTAARAAGGWVTVTDSNTGLSTSGATLAEAITELRDLIARRRAA